MTETTLSVWKMRLQRKGEWMSASVQNRNPRKLQNHWETRALLFSCTTALVFNPVHQIRQAQIAKDDLIKKQLLGSFLAQEALAASPDAAWLAAVFAQHILLASETKPAFPRLEIIRQMKSCTPDTPERKMDLGAGGDTELHLALPHRKGGGKKVFPFW